MWTETPGEVVIHEPVLVDVARDCDADDLAEFLAARGFDARRYGDCVEVDYADPDPLLAAVDRAVAEWLAASARDLVPVPAGPRRVALRPPVG